MPWSSRSRPRRASLASQAIRRLREPAGAMGRSWVRRMTGNRQHEEAVETATRSSALSSKPSNPAEFKRRSNPLVRDESTASSRLALPSADKSSRSTALVATPRVGWDVEEPLRPEPPAHVAGPGLAAQILALFAEPGVSRLSEAAIAKALGIVRQDIRAQLEALVQAGHLDHEGASRSPDAGDLFVISAARKQKLEQLYITTARELGETALLAQREADESAGEDDEPRLPITAGVLSIFLPGTGQLLNGDIGRASLFFSIWALAMLTPYSSIILFVRLYAGAEAFFNAKIRRLERERALGPGDATDAVPRALRPSV